ncbi:hypothetical protein GGS26DRAFT_559107 [Hypomontagnella submonticulosa]|nr:hypothetical protein GGS26DRAFT_559107 [Hypomontagnella submonticulosa]
MPFIMCTPEAQARIEETDTEHSKSENESIPESSSSDDASDDELVVYQSEETDITILIPEGPYFDIISELRMRTKDFFPVDMMIKLESDRRTQLNRLAALRPSARRSHPRTAFVVVQTWHHDDPEQEDHQVVARALSREEANVQAMVYFYQENPSHLLRPTLTIGQAEEAHENRNIWSGTFREIKNYDGVDSLRPLLDWFPVDHYSAWGVSKAGCLGLLADHGDGLHIIYVKETEVLA